MKQEARHLKKWIVVVVILVVALGLGYVVSARIWGFPIFASPKSAVKEEPQPTMYNLGLFVTNLLDPGRYIRVNIDVELRSQEAAQTFTSRVSEVKTEVYALLRSKSYQELIGEEGLKNLQKDIFSRIDARVPGAVINVFFSEFVIQ